MLIGTNPVQTVYVAQVVRHLLTLMEETLTPEENQLLLLHCGMGCGGPVDFSRLAAFFRLSSAQDAEDAYCAAVVKTREAIPGSALENWIVNYRKVYHLGRSPAIFISPSAPIPR